MWQRRMSYRSEPGLDDFFEQEQYSDSDNEENEVEQSTPGDASSLGDGRQNPRPRRIAPSAGLTMAPTVAASGRRMMTASNTSNIASQQPHTGVPRSSPSGRVI